MQTKSKTTDGNWRKNMCNCCWFDDWFRHQQVKRKIATSLFRYWAQPSAAYVETKSKPALRFRDYSLFFCWFCFSIFNIFSIFLSASNPFVRSLSLWFIQSMFGSFEEYGELIDVGCHCVYDAMYAYKTTRMQETELRTEKTQKFIIKNQNNLNELSCYCFRSSFHIDMVMRVCVRVCSWSVYIELRQVSVSHPHEHEHKHRHSVDGRPCIFSFCFRRLKWCESSSVGGVGVCAAHTRARTTRTTQQ